MSEGNPASHPVHAIAEKYGQLGISGIVALSMLLWYLPSQMDKYAASLDKQAAANERVIEKLITNDEKRTDRLTTGMDGLRQDLRELKYGKGANGP